MITDEQLKNYREVVKRRDDCYYNRAMKDLIAEVTRLRKVEEYAAEMEAIGAANRGLAQDIKDYQREMRHAEGVGCIAEWWTDNGARYELAVANLLDRLTREQ